METCLQLLEYPQKPIKAERQSPCCCSTASELALKIGDQLANAGVKIKGDLPCNKGTDQYDWWQMLPCLRRKALHPMILRIAVQPQVEVLAFLSSKYASKDANQ